MEGGAQYNPRTVEEVFKDFKARRVGLIKALTTDVDDFFQQCDPEKENLCLYGFPSGNWEVNLPAEEVPPELPEPALGINFARDGMKEQDWLALVAVHSDAWLLSVAYYFGARFGFERSDRKRLFNMINELPTLFEIVTGTAKKPVKEKSSNSNNGSNKTKSSSKAGKNSKNTTKKEDDDEGALAEEEEEEEDHSEAFCGACGESYGGDDFWICCDICETWFHGKCVKITPAKAEHIKQYKCPSCTNKRHTSLSAARLLLPHLNHLHPNPRNQPHQMNEPDPAATTKNPRHTNTVTSIPLLYRLSVLTIEEHNGGQRARQGDGREPHVGAGLLPAGRTAAVM
ncbi:hypothetical protein V2J09_022265 [Rumex salicifolius]